MITLLFVIIFIYSVILHEIAHGYVAYFLGDETAYRMGRLSLNPLVHIDPVGSIIIPIVLYLSHSPFIFGFAKPVPINPFNFSRVRNIRLGIALCSAAGPIANLLLAFVFVKMAKFSFNPYAIQFFIYAAGLNVILAVFNLLPIPGFDGSHVISAFLPPKALLQYERLKPYGMLIALLLLVTGVIGAIIFPIVGVILKWML